MVQYHQFLNDLRVTLIVSNSFNKAFHPLFRLLIVILIVHSGVHHCFIIILFIFRQEHLNRKSLKLTSLFAEAVLQLCEYPPVAERIVLLGVRTAAAGD